MGNQSRWHSVYSHAGEIQSCLAMTGLLDQHLGFWDSHLNTAGLHRAEALSAEI